MIYLLQILKGLDNASRQQFIVLFNDLSYEIEEMGYKGHETELVYDMLINHYGIFMECENQLKRLTDVILKYQGKLNYFNSMVVA